MTAADTEAALRMLMITIADCDGRRALLLDAWPR